MAITYTISEATLPDMRLMGVFVHTTMEKVSVDASHLWEHDFMPKAVPLYDQAQGGLTSYGMSVMGEAPEPDGFTYWAALPEIEGRMPEGFSSITIPTATYVSCRIKDMDEFISGFQALWDYIQETPGMEPDMEKATLEQYLPEYPKPGSIVLFMPIKK